MNLIDSRNEPSEYIQALEPGLTAYSCLMQHSDLGTLEMQTWAEVVTDLFALKQHPNDRF